LAAPFPLAAPPRPVNRHVSVATGAHAPRRAPAHADTRASGTSAAASAAGARTPGSSRAGHNRRRKNSVAITLAASGTASPARGSRVLRSEPRRRRAPLAPDPLVAAGPATTGVEKPL